VVVPKIKTINLKYFISANGLATQQFIRILPNCTKLSSNFGKNHVFQLDKIKNFAGSNVFHENHFYFFFISSSSSRGLRKRKCKREIRSQQHVSWTVYFPSQMTQISRIYQMHQMPQMPLIFVPTAHDRWFSKPSLQKISLQHLQQFAKFYMVNFLPTAHDRWFSKPSLQKVPLLRASPTVYQILHGKSCVSPTSKKI
jgi:hypothetical protein